MIYANVSYPSGTAGVLDDAFKAPLVRARLAVIKLLGREENKGKTLKEMVDLTLKKRNLWGVDDPDFEVDLTAAGSFQGGVGVKVMQLKVAAMFPAITDTSADVEAVYNNVKAMTEESWYSFVDIDGQGIVETVLEVLNPLASDHCPENTIHFDVQPYYQELKVRLARCARYEDEDGVWHFGADAAKACLQRNQDRVKAAQVVTPDDVKVCNIWKWLLDEDGQTMVTKLTDKVHTVSASAGKVLKSSNASASSSSKGAESKTAGKAAAAGKRKITPSAAANTKKKAKGLFD